MKKNIALVSLGCDKNRVDSERALYSILDSGFSLVSDYASADVIMVNTCAFIESARKEAIDTILEMAEYKSTGKCKKLIVTGCLPQKHIKEIKDELPEVDAFFGVKDYDGIAKNLTELFEKDGQVIKVERQDGGTKTKRILTTPQHYAFLRVADGCNNKCSYCTIPSIRGGYVSEPFERVIEEAKGLVNSGVKELILVAQDVTRYGQDLYGEIRLVSLL
ncbi:MAG: radical SAM protein, partial [Firmicutes bacterium]|nr:radical SAM protein [Bacillota bacterium]